MCFQKNIVCYKFYYHISDTHTKDQKYHYEERHNDVTRGQYAVADPDGTIRTVKYASDGSSGFTAWVTKSGVSVYPRK